MNNTTKLIGAMALAFTANSFASTDVVGDAELGLTLAPIGNNSVYAGVAYSFEEQLGAEVGVIVANLPYDIILGVNTSTKSLQGGMVFDSSLGLYGALKEDAIGVGFKLFFGEIGYNGQRMYGGATVFSN